MDCNAGTDAEIDGDNLFGSSAGEAAPAGTPRSIPETETAPCASAQATNAPDVSGANEQHPASQVASTATPICPEDGAKRGVLKAAKTFESTGSSATSHRRTKTAEEAAMTMVGCKAVTSCASGSMPDLETIFPDMSWSADQSQQSLQRADTAPLTGNTPKSKAERKKQSVGQLLDAHERLIQRLDRLCEAMERNAGALSAQSDDSRPPEAHSDAAAHDGSVCSEPRTLVGMPGSPGSPGSERPRCQQRRAERTNSTQSKFGSGLSDGERSIADSQMFWIDPCYDELPDVEVSIKIYSLSNLNAARQCFNADFAVMLDWIDPALKYQVHYFDRELGAQGSQYVIPRFTEEVIFNPRVLVDNALHNLEPMSGADSAPRIGGVVNKALHLKKTMRFRGTLTIPSNDLRMFPFDVQALRIELKSMRSSVAKGGRSSPSLVGPSIRRIAEKRDDRSRTKNLEDTVNSPSGSRYVIPHDSPRMQRRRSSNISRSSNASNTLISPSKSEATNKDGHVVHEDNISLGELKLWKWGPMVSRDNSRDDEYGIVFGFKRVSSQYIFDFVIQVVVLLLACVALYIDPAEEEALANRASITIVLVLTLVTFSLDRPQALLNIPYSTFHDIFRRTFVLMMVTLSVAVCVVPAVCKAQALSHAWLSICTCCTWCGASTFDCIITAATLAITFLVVVAMIMTARYHTKAQEQMIADKIIDKSVDENSHSWEADIMNYRGNSEKRLDRSRCQRCLQFWTWCSARRKGGLDELQRVVPGPHAPTSTRQEVIVPDLPPSGPSFVLDVGGGEVGLYRYSVDDDLGPCSSGGNKAKFDLLGAFSEVQMYATDRPEGRALALHIASELRTLDFGTDPADSPEVIVGFAARQDSVEQAPSSPFDTSAKLVPLAFTEAAEQLVKYLEDEVRNQGVNAMLRCFTPPKPMVAGFEICAVEYLLQHADFPFRVHGAESSHRGREDFTSSQPRHEQFSFWLKGHLRDGILTKCRRNGKCTVAEFVHGFIDLPLQPTQEKTAQELMSYFESWDGGLGELPWNSLVKLIMANQRLLQAVVRERLFAGIISVSTSACHVARKDSRSRDRMGLALRTLPLGNKDASRLSHFPKGQPVTREHAEAWRTAVRVRLEEVHGMERNLRGLFVAISAAWYAAQETGIAEQLVPAGEAVKRLNTHLLVLLNEGGQRKPGTGDHQRSIANLVLVSEVIEYVLSKDSWLIFRREWTMPSGGIVATWCLGWYLLGEPRCEEWARRRRVQR